VQVAWLPFLLDAGSYPAKPIEVNSIPTKIFHQHMKGSCSWVT
jgi:hypothetical protein